MVNVEFLDYRHSSSLICHKKPFAETDKNSETNNFFADFSEKWENGCFYQGKNPLNENEKVLIYSLQYVNFILFHDGTVKAYSRTRTGIYDFYRNNFNDLVELVVIKNGFELFLNGRIHKIAKCLYDFTYFFANKSYYAQDKIIELNFRRIDLVDFILDSDRLGRDTWCAFVGLLTANVDSESDDDKMRLYEHRRPISEIKDENNIRSEFNEEQIPISFDICVSYLTPMFPLSMPKEVINNGTVLKFSEIEKVSSIINKKIVSDLEDDSHSISDEDLEHPDSLFLDLEFNADVNKVCQTIVSYFAHIENRLSEDKEAFLNCSQFVEYYSSISLFNNLDTRFFDLQYNRVMSGKTFGDKKIERIIDKYNAFIGDFSLSCLTSDESALFLKSLEDYKKIVNEKDNTGKTLVLSLFHYTSIFEDFSGSPFYNYHFIKNYDSFSLFIREIDSVFEIFYKNLHKYLEKINNTSFSMDDTFCLMKCRSFVLGLIEDHENYRSIVERYMNDTSIPLNFLFEIEGLEFGEIFENEKFIELIELESI